MDLSELVFVENTFMPEDTIALGRELFYEFEQALKPYGCKRQQDKIVIVCKTFTVTLIKRDVLTGDNYAHVSPALLQTLLGSGFCELFNG